VGVVDWLHEPEHRVRLAIGTLIFAVVGWPVSSLTFLAKEPQGVLALSWLAIIYTAVDILATTDVRQNQDDADD
jgi:hypothetical protein